MKLIKKIVSYLNKRNKKPTITWQAFALDDRINLTREVTEQLRKRALDI